MNNLMNKNKKNIIIKMMNNDNKYASTANND